MGHCVRIVLPVLDCCGTDKIGTKESDGRNAEIIGRIVKRWNGVTLSDSVGVWTDNDGVWITDKTIVAECYIGLWTDTVRAWWVKLADHVRYVHKQDCVFLSVRDETALLIGRDDDGITEDTIGP